MSDAYKALLMEFAARMDEIGIQFAMVTLNPKHHGERLGFAASMSLEPGIDLLRQFVEASEEGNVENFQHMVSSDILQ